MAETDWTAFIDQTNARMNVSRKALPEGVERLRRRHCVGGEGSPARITSCRQKISASTAPIHDSSGPLRRPPPVFSETMRMEWPQITSPESRRGPVFDRPEAWVMK
jgi:hypothetical protein